MGLLDDFAGFIKTPEGQGLLSAAFGGLAGAKPGQPWNTVGRAGMAGLLGYQNAREDQALSEYRQAQKAELDGRAAARKQQQDAFSRISAGFQGDPSYKPNMADLLAIDPDAAVKGLLAPNGGIDYSLEPKIGINPETGAFGYFIQDKRGGTKWLDAGVPNNYKYVPGTDYQQPGAFDPRTGTQQPVTQPGRVSAVTGGNGGVAPVAASTPMQATAVVPEIDPLAPWAKLASPKQQDEMKARVYEQDRRRLDELSAQVQQGRSIMRDLDRFGELNRQQATGGLIDKFGWIPTSDPEKREMEAIVARLAPNMRPAGSGTTSDRDLALYLQGLPGIDKTGDVNKSIRDQYAKQLQAAEQRHNFEQQYLIDNGHLNGAADALAMAKERSNSGGLDLSKLTPEQAEALRNMDPDAFNRGVERFQRNSASNAAGKALAELPPPKQYKGKVAVDQETGKRYRSNGMQWVEVM